MIAAPEVARVLATVHVVVLRDKFACGWPEHAVGEPARYLSVAEAFATDWDTDAHFAAYSVPIIKRRLATDLVFAAHNDGVPMMLFVVDIEPIGHAPATLAWRTAERAKIASLLADHPGGYIYGTRGGYRIVFLLAEPIVLRSVRDAAHWKRRYAAWLSLLERRYGILGDPKCSDWTRLFRLPRVLRGGVRQEPETIGDARAIGEWDVEVTIAESNPTLPRVSRRPVLNSGSTDFYSAIAAHDQGDLLLVISGTPLVGGETITLGDTDRRGRRRIMVDGKTTAGFVADSGRIVHTPSRRSSPDRPDGGPLVTTWCRYYGHGDAMIRWMLVKLVPELSRFARARRANRVSTPADFRGDR